ncbi:hypothetical protein [Cupriavidus lacunae]|uniref:hypothetical protein n=1 Tax=Cupriavidus lacunae TaxID=2666307 RepID=UPI003CC60675
MHGRFPTQPFNRGGANGRISADTGHVAAGTLVVGPTFHYGTANSNVSSMLGQGWIDVSVVSVVSEEQALWPGLAR